MSGEDGSLKTHSRDSLVHHTTRMIGHPVEAHLTNGSVYSGILHAVDVEKDFGIILKMASLVKDGTLGGNQSGSEVVTKPPKKTLYIPADELVQVVAKLLSDLSVTSDGKLKAVQSEDSVELLTDSSISKSCRVDQGRELKPWAPDGEAPEGLDNVFDKSLESGGWDQFKENNELFLVESTFKEDIYTTAFDKGSPTRELEEKALKIAGEIEDEKTGDLHVAEGESQPFQNETNGDQSCSASGDHACHLPSEQRSEDFPSQGSSTSESQLGEGSNNNNPEVPHSNRTPEESVSGSGHGDIGEGANSEVGGGTSASKTVAENERQVSQVSGQSASGRSSESGPVPSTSTRPGLSPSSSMSSLPSSEKSTLNPNAKEFKPSQPPAPIRTQTIIAVSSFYYAARLTPVQQMPVMPAAYGIQPQYHVQQQLPRYPGHEYPQTYYPPNAPPQYRQWQQMMMQGEQPRPPNVDNLPLPPP